MIGEDSSNNVLYLIDVKDKKIIKEKNYKPKKGFILENICDKWVFKLENNEKTKLINVKLDKDKNDNNYDLIDDNNNSLIIESGVYLLTLFDNFFIVCKKNGNINCYGCF